MSNLDIIIMPRCDVHDAFYKYKRDFVVSILQADEQGDGGSKLQKPEGVKDHYKFYFNDVDDPESHLNPPTIEDVKNILQLYPLLCGRKVFLHCFAGISRSSASVFALYCRDLGPGREQEAMELTEASAPYKGIWPNDLIISYADQLLGRDGTMVKVLQDWKNEHKYCIAP